MKKQILTLAVLSATSLTFLSACGSGAGITGIDSKENTMPSIAASRINSFGLTGTYNNGGTITDEIDNDDTFDYTFSEKTPETLTLRVRGDRTLIMTVNGVEATLERREGNSDRWTVGNTPYGVTDYTGYRDDNLRDVLAGEDTVIHGTYVFYSTDPNDYESGESSFDINETFGFATFGTQTTASVVANQTATATYGGRVNLRTLPERVTTLDTLSREFYYGSYGDRDNSVMENDLVMTVDFDANTIAGTGDLSKYDSANDVDIDVGVITFASAPITGNGFEGNFTLDSALRTDIGLTNNPTGTYSGNFFGPTANDLVGVMRFNGTNANGDVFGYGGFRAERRRGE